MEALPRGEHAFVGALNRLVEREDRAALAALRRGLGKPSGTVAEMYPLVEPWLPPEAPRRVEEAFFLVGALFGLHPSTWAVTGEDRHPTNLGASFARLAAASESGSVEARFVALLGCHPDDLPQHLRHAVSLLRAHDVPVDWLRLLRDIQHWDHPDRWVQRAWARAFWGAAPATTGTTD